MRYYIKDSTINKVVYFNTINEVVSYFDQLIKRAHGVNKQTYIQHLTDLGHNDDPQGVTLTRVLSEQFNIGIERKDGKLERTDIHATERFINEGYGD
jgi:hypothetical protein